MFAGLRKLMGKTVPATVRAQSARPVVFMHIAKTAGTAVRIALLMRWPDRPFRTLMRPDELVDAWRMDPWSFAGFQVISGHFGTDFIRRFRFPHFKTTFVRDPVERVLSNYMLWKELDLAGLPATLAARVADARRQSLADLLSSGTPFVRAHLCDQQAKQFASRSAIEPGAEEHDYGSDLLPRAVAESERFDFIGFQDDLEAELERLFVRIDAGPAPPVARHEVNASARSPENLALRADPELRSLIRRHNETDIALCEALKSRRAADADRRERATS